MPQKWAFVKLRCFAFRSWQTFFAAHLPNLDQGQTAKMNPLVGETTDLVIFSDSTRCDESDSGNLDRKIGRVQLRAPGLFLAFAVGWVVFLEGPSRKVFLRTEEFTG
jgi:hypothetical protein